MGRMNETNADPIAIVGAGPIGLEMAIALRRAGRRILQFDQAQIAQTIWSFAPGTTFFSTVERIAIAGMPVPLGEKARASREVYLAYLRALVCHFDLRIRTYTRVEAVARRPEGGFELTTVATAGRPMRERHHAGSVILALGDMHRSRMLGVPGEELPHVAHRYTDCHPYFQRDLLIVGGKNSAVEVALKAFHTGARVALSYRRPAFRPDSIKYWLLPEIQSLVKSGHVRGHMETIPVAFRPGEADLQPVAWDDATGAATPQGEPYTITADFVLCFTGWEMSGALLTSAGVALDGPEHAPRVNPETMESNVPGLYVIGTATGGSQREYAVFIENSHVHVERVVRALTGATPPRTAFAFDQAMPES